MKNLKGNKADKTKANAIVYSKHYKIRILTLKQYKMQKLHNKDPIKNPIKVNFIHKLVLKIFFYKKIIYNAINNFKIFIIYEKENFIYTQETFRSISQCYT